MPTDPRPPAPLDEALVTWDEFEKARMECTLVNREWPDRAGGAK